MFLTDGDTDTLSQLRDNVERNKAVGGNDETKGGLSSSTVSCHQLLWGRENALQFAKCHCDDNGKGSLFDVIMGSDLVYVPGVIQPLFETVKTLLDREPNNNKSTMFLLAHCRRPREQGSSVTMEMVLEAGEQAGFSYELVEEEDDISLLVFRWKEK